MVNLRRTLQPTPTKNEKEVTYRLSSHSRNEVISLLEKGELLGGVIGLENYRFKEYESFTLFAPPFFKTKWKSSERESLFILPSEKDTTFIELRTSKSSMFPLKFDSTESLWSILTSITPKDMMIGYQILLSYRQDNWKENLESQYLEYQKGLENPSPREWLRRLQLNINEKINQIVRYEYNHAPIEEVDKKLQENGYRYSIRIILSGKSKKDRMKVVRKLKERLIALSYVNEWIVDTPILVGDIIEHIQKRKLDSRNKRDVLCVSELIPYLVSEPVVHIEKESVGVVETNNVSLIESDNSGLFENNNSLVELLPSGNEEIGDIDITLTAKKISKALKRIKEFKGELVCRDSIISSSMQRLYFTLPKQWKYSELIKRSTIEDLKMFSGIKQLEISQSDRENEFVVSIPLENKGIVYLKDCLNEEFMKFSKESELGFIVGVDMEGNVLMRDLVKGRHLLIGSETGGGKSSFINQLLLTLLMTKKPSELQLFMIDPKLVEFEMYRKYKHVAKIVNNAEDGIRLLKQVIKEMNRRYELFQHSGVKDIVQYNEKYPKNKIPYLLTVIDEYSELSMFNSDVHDYVISISQLGRSSGCILIISTQDPRKEVIPPLVKSNLPSKVAFRCSNRYSYQTFLPKQPPKLYGQGHGVLCFTNQQEDFIEFQSCLITDRNEVDLVESLAEQMNYEKFNFELPEDVEEETDLDKLRNVILETGVCKVGELRGIMKININKLNGLMKELVEEGFLLPPESRQSGYKINPEYNKNTPQP